MSGVSQEKAENLNDSLVSFQILFNLGLISHFSNFISIIVIVK